MAWKFLNIGKANGEIDRLEAELAKLKKPESAAPPAPPAPAAPAAAAPPVPTADTVSLEDLSESVDALSESLTARINTLETKVTTEVARLDKAFTDFQGSAKKIGSHLAAEITGRQGQPPLPAGASAGSAGGDIVSQWDAITDPSAKTLFYRKHKQAIDAAHHAERK